METEIEALKERLAVLEHVVNAPPWPYTQRFVPYVESTYFGPTR